MTGVHLIPRLEAGHRTADRSHSTPAWLRLVRTLHWILAGSFALAFITGDEIMPVHEVAGYTVLSIVALRLLWGLIRTRHARLNEIAHAPRAAFDYLRDVVMGRAPHPAGRRTPVGKLITMTLLAALTVTTVTGILADDTGFASAFEDIHEVAANLTLAFVVLHILGVVVRDPTPIKNLLRAMVAGRKTR